MSATLTAFQAGSGVSASALSSVIRTALMLIVIFWSVWLLYGSVRHLGEHVSFTDLVNRILRLLALVSFFLVLVWLG